MVGRIERNKDLAQDAIENTANSVGNIAKIITTAVADVTKEIGGIVTDAFEMREAAKAARLDAGELEAGEPDPARLDEPVDVTEVPLEDDAEPAATAAEPAATQAELEATPAQQAIEAAPEAETT